MYTRQQREQLNELSMALYGSSSRWQKLSKDPNFRVVVSTENVPQQYIQLRNRRGGPGTIMTIQEGINKKIIPSDFKAPDVSKQVTREVTFEEMVEAMTSTLDMTLISAMTMEEQSAVIANKFANNNLTYHISLVLTKENKENAEVLLKSLSEEQRTELSQFLVDTTVPKEEQKPTKGVPMDAEKFISDYIFAVAHPKESLVEVDKHYAKAASIHSANLVNAQRNKQLRA